MKNGCLIIALLLLYGCASPQQEFSAQRKGSRLQTVINPELISEMQLTYLLGMENWISTNIDLSGMESGKLPTYFDQELYALEKMVSVWKELGSARRTMPDKYAADVASVINAGFLREYVWRYKRQDHWTQPSDLKLQAFEEWSKVHLQEHQAPVFGYIALGK